MNCAQAKTIPIPAFLAALGLTPSRHDGNGTYYHSPLSLSGDATPSFQVSHDGRVFHDWSTGCHGDIVDLAKAMVNNASTSDALAFIEGYAGQIIPFPVRASLPYQRTKESAIVVESVVPLQTKCLLGYLWGRGIHRSIAVSYCVEVHFHFATSPEKHYYSVGWENNAGGYELRNKVMDHVRTISPKDITTVGDLGACPFYVFEGFIDFLSAVQMGITDVTSANAIVLNSTALVERAIASLAAYDASKIICLLDGDDSGRRATKAILEAFPQAVDSSSFYRRKNFNDLNDFLVSSRKESMKYS